MMLRCDVVRELRIVGGFTIEGRRRKITLGGLESRGTWAKEEEETKLATKISGRVRSRHQKRKKARLKCSGERSR